MWFTDEARVGQKGRLTRCWHHKGYRPRVPRDQRFGSAWIFGAVCPERDTGVALVFTRVSTEAMNLLLAEIAQAVPADTQAVLILDNASWHTTDELEVPENITLLPLPPYSPELNAAEKVWQYLKDRRFAFRLFNSVTEIIDACCQAWNALLAETGRIRSLCSFPWSRFRPKVWQEVKT